MGQEVTKDALSRTLQECWTIEGESPVGEKGISSGAFPSSAGHVEPGVNLGGPPPKAKYSLATDSESVGRLNDEKNPC